jgi:hypothetical protein
MTTKNAKNGLITILVLGGILLLYTTIIEKPKAEMKLISYTKQVELGNSISQKTNNSLISNEVLNLNNNLIQKKEDAQRNLELMYAIIANLVIFETLGIAGTSYMIHKYKL